jgi:TetR/AcrR family transcriptional regulator, transcriptional repressor for nem operon
MPYPVGHRDMIRKRIIESARKLFNLHGFDNVSVKQIMAGAGMTHGGFYEYFKGKSALYSEVLSCFLTDPNWTPRWKGISVDVNAADAGAQIVRAYLSRQHFADVKNSCPMVALPNDVRRGGAAVKIAFETVFSAMVALLEKSVSDRNGSARHQRAQAVAALCVGGLIVSRAVHDVGLADTLREACMTTAIHLLDSGASRGRKSGPALRPKRARRKIGSAAAS